MIKCCGGKEQHGKNVEKLGSTYVYKGIEQGCLRKILEERFLAGEGMCSDFSWHLPRNQSYDETLGSLSCLTF